MRLLEAHARIEPVEGLEADDGVERRVRRLPALERPHNDLDGEPLQPGPRDRRQPLTELDADELEPSFRERQRRPARPAADLEYPLSRR